MPDLCCVGSDLQLSYSQTCTLLKTLTQTLTHRLTLLNLSHRYGSAWRSVRCVWLWSLSPGLVLKEFISISSSGEVLSSSTLLLSPYIMYVCMYVCTYICTCVCVNTSIFMYITSCTSSLGVVKALLLHIIFRCPLTESSDFLMPQIQVSWVSLQKCFSYLRLHTGSQTRIKLILDPNGFLQKNVFLHTCHKLLLNMVLVSSSYLDNWQPFFLDGRSF